MLLKHRLGHSGLVRIALVHYSAPPIVGGVETILGEHARLFRDDGHEVSVVCGHGDGAVQLKQIAERATPAAELVSALEPLLAKHDLVVLHNILTMHFHAGLTEALWEVIDRLPQVRFLAWVHDLAACNPDYHLPPLIDPSIHRLSQAHPRVEYLAISEHRRRQFEMLTGHVARVIPNGLDPAAQLELPPHLRALCHEHRVFSREIILLHPTRLLRRKNVELSLRVLAALRAEGRDALLLVTGAHDPHHSGSRDYVESLRALREKLAVSEHALFLNELFDVTNADLIRLYGLADALFFPSRQEGFGLPILEAAWHRLPIFCADLEPMNDLIEHRLTTFSADSHPAEIAELLAQQLHHCFATQARKEVLRRYSWDNIFRQYLAPLLHS